MIRLRNTVLTSRRTMSGADSRLALRLGGPKCNLRLAQTNNTRAPGHVQMPPSVLRAEPRTEEPLPERLLRRSLCDPLTSGKGAHLYSGTLPSSLRRVTPCTQTAHFSRGLSPFLGTSTARSDSWTSRRGPAERSVGKAETRPRASLLIFKTRPESTQQSSFFRKSDRGGTSETH